MNIEFGNPNKWGPPKKEFRWRLRTANGWQCCSEPYWYAITDREPTEEEKRAIEQLIFLKWGVV